MPAGIVAVVTWIAMNPDILLKGEAFVVQLIQDAITVWRTFHTTGQTQAELEAGWAALGVDIQAVRDDWRKRHPVTP